MAHTLSSSQHGIKHQHGIEVIVEKFGSLKGKLKIGCRAFVPNPHPVLTSAFWFANLEASRIGSACNHPKMLLHQAQGSPSIKVTHQNKNGIVWDEVLPGMALDVIAAYQLSIGQPADGGPTIRMALER